MVWYEYVSAWFVHSTVEGRLAWFLVEVKSLYPLFGMHKNYCGKVLGRKKHLTLWESEADCKGTKTLWNCGARSG